MTLISEFRQAADEAAIDLGLDKRKIEIDHSEGDFGFDYIAQLYEDTKGFDFHLRSRVVGGKKKATEMTAFLSINFAEGVAPYSFHENIDYIKGHHHFLSRWVSWAIFNFRQTHQKVNLESLFHDVDIRVYGIPGYCDPAEGEAHLLFNGIIATQKDKVLIYRFRHMDREGYLCRSISYAVFVNPKGLSGFWVVFPDNCGLDSGRGHSTYQHFEELIEMLRQRFEVEVRRYDIAYDELETFLLKKSTGFFSVFRTNELDTLLRYSGPVKVLHSSEKEFKKFMDRLEKKEYPQALRDLRALVQQAQENVAKLKNLEYSKISNPDVNKLAAFLIKNKQIDGRLNPWFLAFTSIANIASHGDFPTKQCMENPVLRTRVLLAFHLGIHLLEELDNVVRPEIPVIDAKFEVKGKSE